MPRFKVRTGPGSATEFLNGLGIPMKLNTLQDMACKGNGPRYRIVNGRALYSEKDLLEWAENHNEEPAPRVPMASLRAAQ